MKFVCSAVFVCLITLPATAHAQLEGLIDLLVDGGNDYAWERVELPGTVCGDGSQYKFWVHDTGSPNLLFFFEGGGACWDYDLCSGRAGTLGAANPNGLPDDYIDSFTATYASPVVNGADPGIPFRSRTDLPTKGWNIVYMPYCTGDVHVGNSVALYEDPDGIEPPLEWHHAGFNNTTAAAEYAAWRFPSVDKMVVSGYSAGGTASSAAYYFVRTIVNPNTGYLLNDSGPIHFAPDPTSLSRPLHDFIRESWALDSVFEMLPPSFDPDDFGSINEMVSFEFPGDQIAYTGYLSDYNYSRFSYERFYPNSGQAATLARWRTDQYAFVNGLQDDENVSYFIPWERPINDSHCSTIITFIGSHACEEMEKKRRWWEYFEWPWGQTYKCYSEFVPMETFLERWINDDQVVRVVEPENYYNRQDPGMKIVGPIIEAALDG